MKPYVSPQATQQALIGVESQDPHILLKMAQWFKNGADPWAVNKRGVHLLDLCLQDGRHALLSLWTDAARRHFHYGTASSYLAANPLPALKNSTLSHTKNYIHMIDLVGSFVHLTKNDRQVHLRRFLFGSNQKKNAKTSEERFVYQLALHASPQRWHAISNTLLLFPELDSIKVPAYPPIRVPREGLSDSENLTPDSYELVMARIVDEFVLHAPMQVLLNHMGSSQHRVNMDWRNNPVILDRIRHFSDPSWADHWKEAGFMFSGVDDQGNTLLHHYLQNTPTNMLSAGSIDFLLEHSAPWTAQNFQQQSCEDLVLLHKGSPLLDAEVAQMFNYLHAPNQSFQTAHARLVSKP